MITLFILLKLLFGGGKEDSHKDCFDELEEDYEEMLIMGMLDED